MKVLASGALSVLLLGSAQSVFGQSDMELQFLARGTITFDKGSDQTTLVSDTPGRIIVEASLGGRTLRLWVDTGNPYFHIHQSIIDQNPLLFENTSSSYFKNSHFVKALRLGSVLFEGVPTIDSADAEALENANHVDGTLGMTLMRRLNWRYDATAKTLTFFKKPPTLKDPIDINPFYDLRLVVDGTIDGSKASWAIDTGWNAGYLISGPQKAFLPPSTVLHSVSGKVRQTNYMQDNTKDPTVGVLRNVVIGTTSLPAMSFFLFWSKEAYSHDNSGLFSSTGILPLQFFEGGTLQVNGPGGQVAWSLPKRSSPTTGNNLQLYGFAELWVSNVRAEVVGIDEQSWSYRNGLRIGDVFLGNTLTIGGEPVTSADSEYLRRSPHAVVAFDYEREGSVRHLEAPYFDAMRNQLFGD